MAYENIINAGDNTDIGTAIYKMVTGIIREAGTAYLAEIVSINDNKVSVKKVINQDSNNPLIINNCLVGFPYSDNFNIHFNLNIGDKGLCIILEDDITNYKLTGEAGTPYTNRTKNVNDSIFIPLSLFNTKSLEGIDFIISNKDGTVKLEFSDNNAILQANLIAIKSQNTTLKTALSELSNILANAQILQSQSGTQPFDPGTVANFNSWKADLDNLFLE